MALNAASSWYERTARYIWQQNHAENITGHRKAITSALRTMKRESEEWGGKEMVIELSV
jgi:hypothetical protein